MPVKGTKSMDIKKLQEEQELIMHRFTLSMAKWLQAFNAYADKLIENSKNTEEELRRLCDEQK